MAKRRPAVLVVEDEAILAHDLQHTLSGLGYDAFGLAASADEAIARATERRPDIALIDIRIKGRTDGIRTAQLLQEQFGIPVVYLTAHADDATLERAKQTRPYGYLVKPVRPVELKSAIEIALFRHGTNDSGARPGPDRAAAPPSAPARAARAPGVRMVRRQVEQILASNDFDASRRSKDFLRFIVEEGLAGRGDDLTQFAIATRVFGRRDDFDAVVDPIVRIQAGRLRRSLERYYLLSGKDDAVRIELPRGTYLPVFTALAAAEPPSLPPGSEGPDASSSSAPGPAVGANDPDTWPTVAIRPFEPIPAGPDQEAAASRVTEELLLELGHYRDVRPLRERNEAEPARPEPVRFVLGGRVLTEEGGLRVTARLVDSTSGEQLWGDEYHTTARPGQWSGTAEDIGRVIAARIGGEEGVLLQLLAAERRKRGPGPITPFGAILLSYEFFLGRDPQSVGPALQALRQVVRAEPDSALAWTRLARLSLANHCFEVTAIPTPIDEAIADAQQGVRLDPSSRWARCVLASALLVKGEAAAAREELDAALRQGSDSLVYLEIIGYLLALLSDERGARLIRAALERNPHCLPHAQFGLWFDHLRRGEIEAAYAAALEYRDPTIFWRATMRASCLGLLGRAAEAKAELVELLRRKPGFAERGRVLIGYHVKPPEVMERILDGLARAGLKLA